MQIKEALPKIIQEIAKKYAVKMGYASVEEINHGNCESFRDIVLRYLQKKFPKEVFEAVCIRDFESIKEYKHPLFEELSVMPYHAWFMHRGLHYDATAPYGVEDFYELDNYAYYVNLDERKRKEVFSILNQEEAGRAMDSCRIQ